MFGVPMSRASEFNFKSRLLCTLETCLEQNATALTPKPSINLAVKMNMQYANNSLGGF